MAEPVDAPEQNDVPSPALAEAADGEARRALEAILMGAVDPVPPHPLAQLSAVPSRRVEPISHGFASLSPTARPSLRRPSLDRPVT